MLRNWDFRDSEGNETLSQINRQKSAVNLVVASLDRDRRTGQFLDPRKGALFSASLERCECRDFNFAGNAPRKSFRPCMHIYRLAMELGLMDVRFADHATRRAEDRDRIAEQRDIETARLRALPRDPARWGRWDAAVHESGLQRNRQYRGYHLIEDGPGEIAAQGSEWSVHGYPVSLEACACMDFVERQLPCKHIYALALCLRERLPLTRAEYRSARASGKDLVFEFPAGDE